MLILLDRPWRFVMASAFRIFAFQGGVISSSVMIFDDGESIIDADRVDDAMWLFSINKNQRSDV